MEDLLSYSRYDYLICFCLDEYDGIYVHTTSNRAIEMSLAYQTGWNDKINEDLGLIVGTIFQKYFELKSKDKHQLTETDILMLSSILDYLEKIRTKVFKDHGIPPDLSQIVFLLPVDWTEDRQTDMLRTLFLETGWIAADDGESKLVMVPFVEAFVDFLHKFADHQIQLGRERKYLMLSVCETNDHKKITYTCTCLQMQSAKELIAVSKTLASSDFLLVPTILDSRSIRLPELNDVLLVVIKKLLTEMQIKSRNDIQCGLADEDKREAEVSKIASKFVKNLFIDMYGISDASTLPESEFLQLVDLYKSQLQDLSSLSYHQFMKIISLDASVQQHTKQVVDFIQSFLDQYGLISNSPDGIQDIILCNTFSLKAHYFYFIKEAFLQAKLVRPETSFISIPDVGQLGECTIQKPLKMIQIAYAILPPVILNEEKFDNMAFDTMQEDNNSFLPMNSYYVQVNIEEQQIKFTLNKVIKTSSSKNAAQLFTVQERKISINGLVSTASDEMWNHYQRLESEGHLGVLIDWCHEHEPAILSTRHYECFSANMKKIVRAWCQDKQIFTNEELDAYHSVFIDDQCECALKITRRMLLEVGMKSAIANVATTIIGGAFSNDYFGLYQVSAWVVRGCTTSIVNPHYLYSLERFLQEKLRKGFQIHQRKPLMFFDNDAEVIMAQYLGRGGYSQISSTTYTIKFSMLSQNNAYVFGLHDNHLDQCENIPVQYEVEAWKMKFNNLAINFKVTSDYIPILHKGSTLSETGISKKFLFKEGRNLRISIYAQDSSQDGTYQSLITSLWFTDFSNGHSEVSVSIVPEHHSSSVSISMSRIATSKREVQSIIFEKTAAYYDKKSVSIHERLNLKRMC
ncbi:hypothetical protein PS15p_208918 [Mucor circinelloides]